MQLVKSPVCLALNLKQIFITITILLLIIIIVIIIVHVLHIF